MATMFRGFLMAAMAVILIGVILDVISVASDEWTTFAGGVTSGLWRVCPPEASCTKISPVSDDMEAIRAMMLLSVVLSGVCLVTAIVELAFGAAKQRTSRWITRFVCALTFIAALFALIGVAIYAANIYDDYDDALDPEYGYSFWLGVVAFILFVIAGFLFAVSAILRSQARRRRKRAEEAEKIYQRDFPYGVFTKNPRLRDTDYNRFSGKYPGRYQDRSYQERAYQIQNVYGRTGPSPGISPYGGVAPGYFVAAPMPFSVYNHGDSGVAGARPRANYAPSGQRISPSAHKTDYDRSLINKASSVYGQSSRSNYGNTVYQQEAAYGRSNKGYLGNTGVRESTTNYLQVPGASSRGVNNFGSSVYATSNGIDQNGFGVSTRSSRADRDEYGYPLNYQRDL